MSESEERNRETCCSKCLKLPCDCFKWICGLFNEAYNFIQTNGHLHYAFGGIGAIYWALFVCGLGALGWYASIASYVKIFGTLCTWLCFCSYRTISLTSSDLTFLKYASNNRHRTYERMVRHILRGHYFWLSFG
jgi:hypothetical protein